MRNNHTPCRSRADIHRACPEWSERCCHGIAGCVCCCHCLSRRIAAAIREAGLQGKAHPLDYLQFFCLAKRESNEQYHGGVSSSRGLGIAASLARSFDAVCLCVKVLVQC